MSEKRKKIKKGILGVPKRKKILFLINDFNSSTESDSEEDATYSPVKTPTKTNLKRTNSESTIKQLNKNLEPITENYSSNWSSDIPYEILLKIFINYAIDLNGDVSQLENLKKVCKYWSSIADDPKLWFCLKLSVLFEKELSINQKSLKQNFSREFNSKLISMFKNPIIKTKFSHIRILDLSNVFYLTCDLLKLILTNCNCKILTNLNISNCKKISVLSKNNFYFENLITNMCPNLEIFNLSNLKQLNLLKLPQNLVFLDISHNTLPVNSLTTIGDCCCNLQSIDISHCILKGVVNFEQFSEKCSKLKYLRMFECYPKTKYTSITSVLESPVSFLNLENFYLSFYKSFGANLMIMLALKICKDSENLKLIDLRSYKSPLDSNFNSFSFIKSSKLEKLYLCNSVLSEADSIYLSELISGKWLRSLIELDLSSSNITYNALSSLIESFIKNSNEIKLKVLNLTGTHVDTELIDGLINNVKSLEVLNLTSCRSVERRMKKILSLNDLKNLRNSIL